MSGGHWNNANDCLAHEILGYGFDFGCGLSGAKHDAYLKAAVRENPMEDPEISALIYDLFCILHSYDWAESGDTDKTDYQRDVAEFKKRWLKKPRKAQIQEMIDICLENLKDELYGAFVYEPDKSE